MGFHILVKRHRDVEIVLINFSDMSQKKRAHVSNKSKISKCTGHPLHIKIIWQWTIKNSACQMIISGTWFHKANCSKLINIYIWKCLQNNTAICYQCIFKMAAASSAFHGWNYEWFISICLISGNTKPLVANGRVVLKTFSSIKCPAS